MVQTGSNGIKSLMNMDKKTMKQKAFKFTLSDETRHIFAEVSLFSGNFLSLDTNRAFPVFAS